MGNTSELAIIVRILQKTCHIIIRHISFVQATNINYCSSELAISKKNLFADNIR